jgi:RNA polymerase sigma factor (sigma-70 family)
LLAGVAGGDEAALRKLIDRYDRLVRYAIFRATKDRCAKDPHWLDAIASNTWAGFVTSVRRNPAKLPQSPKAYLVRIARNQVVSALRRSPAVEETGGSTDDLESAAVAAPLEEPGELLERLELIEVVQECLAELGPDDRTLAEQLEAITDRKWREASAALGLSESTLRSRWKRVLDRLRQCVERKTGVDVAPQRPAGDR